MLAALLLAAATALPFDLVDNRVLVPVTINGKGPYRLILDTGASGLTVREEVASELNLPVMSASTDAGVGEAVVRSTQRRVQSVVIGGHDLGAMRCNVISFADAPSLWGRERLDGIIGRIVFDRWIVTIDYAKHVVTLSDDVAAGDSARIRIPITFHDHIPVIDGRVSGAKGRFGIDTGARSSMLLASPFVERNHLDRKLHATEPMITGWGIGGAVRSRLARLPVFAMGPIRFPSIVVRLSTQHAGALARGALDGLLGPGLLARFVVTFDYRDRFLQLEKNSGFSEADRWDGTGMWLAQNGDAFEVLDVMPNGPAATAGLRAGDRVVAIDGRRTATLSLPEERLRLYFDGTSRTVRFTLADGREVVVALRALV